MVKRRSRSKRSTGKSKSRTEPPSLGKAVCDWIETCLVHAEGDFLGQSFRLRAWQRGLIERAYQLNADGSRVYKRVLWGFPKGNGKTELAAAIACCELGGPVVFSHWDGKKPVGVERISPDIPVGAASFEQADILFGAARTMISESAELSSHFEVYDTEILLKNGIGRMYRVAAVAGTNDGKRPTFFVADELHEWVGNKERVHLVISNGRAKRADSWELNISTAGWDPQSLLGRLYGHGKRVAAGEADDPTFLMEWFEPRRNFDITKRRGLSAAIKSSNKAIGDFLPLEGVLQRYSQIPEFEFRRYHLNQWVATPERWLPIGAWEKCKNGAEAPKSGTEITLGFDGSYSGDSTALVGCTLEGYLFVIGAWEKPAGTNEWRVDIIEVENRIREACKEWQVAALAMDPFRWQRTMAVLGEEGLPVVEWPSHTPSRMVPACAQFYDSVVDGRISHDGDERLAKHIANSIVKVDHRGPRITKDHKDSERKIDLAVAAVIAYDMVVRHEPEFRSVYEDREMIVI